jgi:transketolase
VFRPYEQIRLDVALHNLNVKIIGNGGGFAYGIMGASHHALEDIAVLSVLQDFACFIPFCNSDVAGACEALFAFEGPSYLRLGFGVWPKDIGEFPPFSAVRQLARSRQVKPKVTVAGMGPVLLNILPWILANGDVDVFVISRMPIDVLPEEFLKSVDDSHLLWVIEEHSARGGLGEHLSALLAQRGVPFRLRHSHARGYPDGLYGSQSYHQTQSHLDARSLQSIARELIS